jgi:hypothetical protein
MSTGTRPRRIHFHTFGCRANQYDTERMRQLLELRGCETVGDPALADAVVVNSCTVTQGADAELRRYVRGVSRRSDGDLQVVVAGCAAAVGLEAMHALEGVTGVVPGQDPGAVADSLGVLPRSADEMDAALLDRCASQLLLLPDPRRPRPQPLPDARRHRCGGAAAVRASPGNLAHRHTYRPVREGPEAAYLVL